MLDAGDVYTAGLNFELISVLSEVYNLGKPEYYVVAVAKATDPETELIYLKNKRTCHTGKDETFPFVLIDLSNISFFRNLSRCRMDYSASPSSGKRAHPQLRLRFDAVGRLLLH